MRDWLENLRLNVRLWRASWRDVSWDQKLEAWAALGNVQIVDIFIISKFCCCYELSPRINLIFFLVKIMYTRECETLVEFENLHYDLLFKKKISCNFVSSLFSNKIVVTFGMHWFAGVGMDYQQLVSTTNTAVIFSWRFLAS